MSRLSDSRARGDARTDPRRPKRNWMVALILGFGRAKLSRRFRSACASERLGDADAGADPRRPEHQRRRAARAVVQSWGSRQQDVRASDPWPRELEPAGFGWAHPIE